jgi:hypothetical protein
VTIYDSGTSIGTASLGTSGTWSFSTLLGQGTHTLSAVATDTSGNTSSPVTEPTITVIATTSTPTITVTSVRNNSSNPGGNNYTISGMVTDAGNDFPSGTFTITTTPTSGPMTFTYDGTALTGTLTVTPAGSYTFTETGTNLTNHRILTVTATDNNHNTGTTSGSTPAGIAGQPINLGLTDPSGGHAAGPIALTVTGIPAGWSLSQGTNLGNGTWMVQTNNLSQLAVTTAAAFVGAMLLSVTETWTNADGTTGGATIADNVEAYSPGSPIFAVSGNDTLTGAGANNEFVFAQPIGNDTIYGFNVASGQIYLIGFSNIASFSNLAMANDANGNAVITLASGETITVIGVNSASLTASNFVFNQEPVTNNTGLMAISDGAILPLGGTIYNTGTIALNSTGDVTALEILVNGVTLQGGGQLILSNNSQNVIFGVSANAILTNFNNTISGAGLIGSGDGTLTLINDINGRIEANDAGGVLTLNTGHSITNAGLLEASNGGTLMISDGVSGGTATIAGGTLVFNASSNVNVTFDNGTGTPTYGELVLADAPAFTGQIFGFTGTAPGAATSDAIDLTDINFANLKETYTSVGTGGTLTVSDGTNTANLSFNGAYTPASFNFASDGHGGTLITDPPVEGTTTSTDNSLTTTPTDSPSTLGFDVDQTANDPSDPLPSRSLQNGADSAPPQLTDLPNPSALPQQAWDNADSQAQLFGADSRLSAGDALDLSGIAFGANTTLGYSPNGSGIGGTLSVSDGTHIATIALFGQYAAAGFQLSSDQNHGALVTYSSSQVSENNVLITIPNHKS